MYLCILEFKSLDLSAIELPSALLVGVDRTQHKRYRIPSGENVNVAAGHDSSDTETTSEEQIDSDPACNVGAAAPDPIAAPDLDEPQTGGNSDDESTGRPRALSSGPARLELGGEDRRESLLSSTASSSDGSEVEADTESAVDEHRECKLNHDY